MTKLSRKLVFVALALVLAISVAVCVACKEKTYTLTYSAGEGTGTASSAEHVEGAEVTLAANTFTAPEGKEFAGWLVEGETTAREAGSKFTMPAKAVTLTAQWKTKTEPKPSTYAVTYAKGDHGTGTAPAAVQKEVGAKFNLESAALFTAETGYKFDGWSDGTQKYAAGVEFTMPAKAVTFTAQWKAVYTVTFDPNNDSTPWSVTVDENGLVEIPAKNPEISSGKTFRYWAHKGIEYNFAAPVTEDLELTAVYAWKVTFLAGEGATGTVDSQWVNTWTANGVTLPEQTGLSNGDKVFAGWFDGQQTYQAGDIYVGTGNVTLTAQWKDASSADKFTLTFTAGDHGVGTPPTAIQLAEGETTILPDGTGLSVEQGEGYDDEVFLGWSIKWNGPILAAGSVFTMPAGNVTLQARWGEQPVVPATFTVTYKSGDHGTGADITETLNAGKITLKAADIFTAEQGYVFNGWKLVGGTENDVFPSEATYTLSANVEFVAMWTACYSTLDNGFACYLFLFPEIGYGYLDIEENIVEFYAEINGTAITVTLENETVFTGTFDGSVLNIEIKYGKQTFTFGTVQTQQHTVTFNPANGEESWTVKVNHGATVAKPTLDPVINDESGRVFRRWSTEEGEFIFTTPITQDIVLEATYGYKVTFNAGDGASGSVNPLWSVGGGITLPSGSGLSNGSKTFAGWSDGKNTYKAGARFPVDSCITLTAVWEETEQPVDGYALSFEGDNGTAPAPQVKQAGDVITLPSNTWFSPSVEGYKFLGWYVKADGFNSKLYQAGDTYTMPANDVTFRAKFGQPTYTITYKAGDQATGADVVITKAQDEQFISLKSLIELSNPFTVNEGYVLAGWKVQGDASGTMYYVGEDYELKGDVTFIAQWTLQTMLGFEDTTGTSYIYMTVGNGSVGSGSFYIYGMDDETGFTYTLSGETITFKMNDNNQFVGTYSDKILVVTITYGGVDYVFDSNQAASGPKVTFDANGGSGDAPEANLTETANGYKLTLPAADTFTAPENKQFKEWNIVIDGKDFKSYKPGSSITLSSSDKQITVTAVWEDIPVVEEPTGIEFVGSCTVPTKTGLGGSTIGGQTFVKFVIDFDSLTVAYFALEGNGTETATVANLAYCEDNHYGDDALYYSVIIFNVNYYILVNSEKTKLMLCDSDDFALTNGEFKMDSGSGSESDYENVSLADIADKVFSSDKAFYSATSFGTTTNYTAAKVVWDNNFSSYKLVFMKDANTTSGTKSYVPAEQIVYSDCIYTIVTTSNQTLKFAFTKAQSGEYQLELISLLNASGVELLTDAPVTLN